MCEQSQRGHGGRVCWVGVKGVRRMYWGPKKEEGVQGGELSSVVGESLGGPVRPTWA